EEPGEPVDAGAVHLTVQDQPHRAQTRSVTTSQVRRQAAQIRPASRAGCQPRGMRGGGGGEESDARRTGESDGTSRPAEVFGHIAGEHKVAIHALAITAGLPVMAGQHRVAQSDPVRLSEGMHMSRVPYWIVK